MAPLSIHVSARQFLLIYCFFPEKESKTEAHDWWSAHHVTQREPVEACPGACPGLRLIVPASVHVGQFFEAWPPLAQVIVVLLTTAGRVEWTDRTGRRAAALVIKNQQGVIRGCCGVVIRCSETLQEQKFKGQWLQHHDIFRTKSSPCLTSVLWIKPLISSFYLWN